MTDIKKSSAKRCLFGSPDPGKTKQLLRNHIDKVSVSKSKEWNFNFKDGTPLKGRYDWTPCKEVVINPEKRVKLDSVSCSSYFKKREDKKTLGKSQKSKGSHSKQLNITGKDN